MNNIKSFSFLTCSAIYLLAPLEVVLLLLTGLAGCANQRQFKALEQICVPDTPKQQAMQIAEDVLGKMHFIVAKADTEQGFLRTRPLPGAQFFEFWRSDRSAEGNLHSIRRIVELNISWQGERLCIDCDVKVQRLSLPKLRATGQWARDTRPMQKLNLSPQQRKGMAWVDLGRDPKLETEILKQIEKRIVTRAP